MNFVTYQEALEFINSGGNKTKVVVFMVKDCPTCDDFLPHVFFPAIEERADHFEVVAVDMGIEKFPFPPVATPTVYFYIPNTTEPMPLFRVGGTMPKILHKDLDSMIKVKDEGLSLSEAFYRPEEVTSWMQRML